jgi:RecA-family ATPase
MIDLARFLVDVVTGSRGKPNQHLSSKTELRFGTHGSLSVDLEKFVWFDHEANRGGGTLDFIAFEKQLTGRAAFDYMRDELKLPIDDGPAPANGHSNGYVVARKIAATYDYIDESGALLFQVVRYDPKAFAQRRPDGNDGWIWSVKGSRQVPYRLPELVEAIGNDRLVLIVEGEKDVDNLARLGVPATTNARGAGKWTADLAEHFAGARIVIVPDNDDAGRKHADVVANALRETAAEIRLLELPGLPPKGDISNWLDAGGTVDELYGLADRAPAWQKAAAAAEHVEDPAAEESPPAKPLEFSSVAEWHGQDVPERRWLIPRRIPMANVTLLSGDGAAGKTTIALQLCVAVVCGTDWLNAVVEHQGLAFFFTAEEEDDEIQRRLALIAGHRQISFRDLAQLKRWCQPCGDAALAVADRGGSLVRPTMLFEQLEAAAIDARPALIVIEAAADVFPVNENDRGTARQCVVLLRRLAMRSGAAVLLLAHPSLSGIASGSGASGSTAWNNSVRSRLYFSAERTRDGDETDKELRELQVMKANYGPAGERVRVRWQNGVFVPEVAPSTLERAAAESSVDEIFLRCLETARAQGRAVSNTTGRNYAPAVFTAMPEGKGLPSKAFAAAMERLFSASRIRAEKVGPPSRQRFELVAVG